MTAAIARIFPRASAASYYGCAVQRARPAAVAGGLDFGPVQSRRMVLIEHGPASAGGPGNSGTVQATHQSGHVTQFIKNWNCGLRSGDSVKLACDRVTAPAGQKLGPSCLARSRGNATRK